MAASAKEQDDLHLVLKASSQQTGKTPESMVTNIAAFEREFESYQVDSELKQQLAFQAPALIRGHIRPVFYCVSILIRKSLTACSVPSPTASCGADVALVAW